MSKYECSICGYVYDEAVGMPEAGIAPGTKWVDLPDDWECPLCGAAKSDFVLIEEDGPAQEDVPAQRVTKEAGSGEAAAAPAPAQPADMSAAVEDGDLEQMGWGEMAALCSNLARGCEKQHLGEEQALLQQLADYCTGRARAHAASGEPGAAELTAAVSADLAEGFPQAESAALAAADRGARRALTWSGKVTRIVNTLLSRYEKEGPAFLEGNNVYVCSICGFVYVGSEPPELCPVCKVPSWKFVKIEGGRA